MDTTITVERVVRASMERVWECWTRPEHIVRWDFASSTWEAPSAENDLRVGGKFTVTMAAKDGSSKFDFNGVYSVVEEQKRIEYDIEGGRHVVVEFTQLPEGVKVTETIEIEHENPEEKQRSGWQTILDNFTRYAEGEEKVRRGGRVF